LTCWPPPPANSNSRGGRATTITGTRRSTEGTPFKRLRNRTGLARLVLDRRIELRLSQQVVADACRVVQGEVQAWEAGTRIPNDAELDTLARVLDLDRVALAGAETGPAVHRNQLNTEQQAELDALFWGSETKVPDLAARFGLQGRSVHKLVTPVPAGAECPDCGNELGFTARERRRYNFADCPTCRRTRIIGRHRSVPAGAGLDQPEPDRDHLP
jgi:transcriptional regulator with XRE-family HTH domain